MPPSPIERPFGERVRDLPRLGLGISTEFGAGRDGLDVNAFRRARPDLAAFLEIGVDLDRGIDDDAREWVRSGAPVTYHFLDLNLEEGDDLDSGHLAGVRALCDEIRPAWLCGDAGLWYVGRRDRGHGVLMPPILCPESADEMARGIRAARAAVGREVLPENPPAHAYLGRMHLLDYYARVAERAIRSGMEDFDTAATLALNEELKELGVVSRASARHATRLVRDDWWKGRDVKRHHMDTGLDDGLEGRFDICHL